MPGPKPMQDLSSGGKNGLEFESLQRTRELPMNCASSGLMSVNARLKCTGAVGVVQVPPVLPESALNTATGKPLVAVSHTNATLFAPAVVQALVGITSVALPALPEPWPKKSL